MYNMTVCNCFTVSVSNFKVDKNENFHNAFYVFFTFLADRTNGRAYATVLRLSVVCL